MTKREIASLSIKLMGVYFLVELIGWSQLYLCSLTSMRSYNLDTLIISLCGMIPMLIYLAILFLLIVKSEFLASKLIKEDKNFEISLSINKDEIMMIAFCCIGLSLLIGVLPSIAYLCIQYINHIRMANMSPNVQDSYLLRIVTQEIIKIIVKSLIGIYLFIQPKGILNLWKKIRREDT